MRRISTATSTAVASHIKTGSGRPWKVTGPRKAKAGSVKVRMRPSVISCAMQRPVVNRISLATKGYTHATATNAPFQSPAAPPRKQRKRMPGALRDREGRNRTADRQDGADRQINAARVDHQRPAHRQQRHRGRALQKVDHRPDQPPAIKADRQ